MSLSSVHWQLPSPTASNHLSNSTCSWTSYRAQLFFCSLMLMPSVRTSKYACKYKDMMEASIISLYHLLGKTRRICLKSPLRIIVIPLKSFSELLAHWEQRMSLRVLLRASKNNLLAISTSSQIISNVLSMNSAIYMPCLTLQGLA